MVAAGVEQGEAGVGVVEVVAGHRSAATYPVHAGPAASSPGPRVNGHRTALNTPHGVNFDLFAIGSPARRDRFD